MFKSSSIKYDIQRDDRNEIIDRTATICIRTTTSDSAYDIAYNLLQATGNTDCGVNDVVEVKDGIFETEVYIPVNDKDEFEDIKDIYMDWKKSAKDIKPVEVEPSNSESVEVAQVSNEVTDQSQNDNQVVVSENPVQVTESTTDSQGTPNYKIYQNVIDLAGTTLQVGQRYRIDLLDNTTINEVTELSNLAWVEFQTGHTDNGCNGNTTTVMYIEITGQKNQSEKSQSCNSNQKNLQQDFKNAYLRTSNGLKPIIIKQENVLKYGINYTLIIDNIGNETLVNPINIFLRE